MRYRVLKSFVLGPGRVAEVGDVVEIEKSEVRVGGVVIERGPLIRPSFLAPITETDHGAPARDEEPTNRDPEPANRDPRPRRRRAAEGA